MGLPRISPSTVTTVSADKITDCETLHETSIPFSREARTAKVSGVSPSIGVSSIDEGTTLKEYPRIARSSFRRGEADASTRLDNRDSSSGKFGVGLIPRQTSLTRN